jgi:hypothetical protein
MMGPLIVRLFREVLVLLVAAGAGTARPVAHVLQTQGTVTARAADGTTRKVVPFGTIYAQERLDLESDGIVVLAFRRDGHIEQAKGPAEVTVTEAGATPPSAVTVLPVPSKQGASVANVVRQLPPATERGATISLGGGQLPAGTEMGVFTTRGAPSPPQLLPLVDSTVLADRPTFRWPDSLVPRTYRLGVFHNGQKVWDTTTSQTSAAFAGERPLERGETYQWVAAAADKVDEGRPAWSGRFTVATAEQRAQAAEFEKLAADKQVAFMTLALMWYRQNDMLAEAMVTAKRLADLVPQERAFRTALSELIAEASAREKRGPAPGKPAAR